MHFYAGHRRHTHSRCRKEESGPAAFISWLPIVLRSFARPRPHRRLSKHNPPSSGGSPGRLALPAVRQFPGF